jgi:hypothetical protein
MEHRPHTVESNPDTRSAPLLDDRIASREQALDVGPDDAGTDGIGENRFERRSMLPTQLDLVSTFDTGSQRAPSLHRPYSAAALLSPILRQIVLNASTRWSISALECSGDGVMRRRSVPRGTVG